jgi:hypothetical protein
MGNFKMAGNKTPKTGLPEVEFLSIHGYHKIKILGI